MCNLYSMTRAREAMLRLFRVSDNRAAAVEPTPAIFPGYIAPVVRKADDGERELVNLNWGLRAAAERPRTAARHQRARRQDPYQQVLAIVFRAAPLPSAGVAVL
jgi:putative SOS response-associated peptidase YedK